MVQPILGVSVFLFIAFLASEARSKFPWKTVFTGLFMQFLLALLFLKAPIFQKFFLMINTVVLALEEATTAGTSMVFGYLGGSPLPFIEQMPGASYILAFRALPLVLVMSALSSLLFYWKIIPKVVGFFSSLFRKSLGLGGAESVGVTANIFVGMVEAPLLVRPYVKRMSRSELFTLMTSGMATIAGTVMVLYGSILSPVVEGIMGHILVASIISVPASIVVAKIMVPETAESTGGDIANIDRADGSMDAICKGTIDGVHLLINITAMLLVLVALVHLVNSMLSLFPSPWSAPLTLQSLLGRLMAPWVWLIGIPWKESSAAGMLMGTKTVLNELLAYLDLSMLPKGALSEKSTLIMTYAMCGFANPGSLGIMLGGLGAMAPERRKEIVAFGGKSILAGTLATSMTGALVGLIL